MVIKQSVWQTTKSMQWVTRDLQAVPLPRSVSATYRAVYSRTRSQIHPETFEIVLQDCNYTSFVNAKYIRFNIQHYYTNRAMFHFSLCQTFLKRKQALSFKCQVNASTFGLHLQTNSLEKVLNLYNFKYVYLNIVLKRYVYVIVTLFAPDLVLTCDRWLAFIGADICPQLYLPLAKCLGSCCVFLFIIATTGLSCISLFLMLTLSVPLNITDLLLIIKPKMITLNV